MPSALDLAESEADALLAAEASNPKLAVKNDDIVERDPEAESIREDLMPRLRKIEFDKICHEMAAAESVNLDRPMKPQDWRENYGYKWLRENWGGKAPVAKYRVTDRMGAYKPFECDAVDEGEAIQKFYIATKAGQPSKISPVVVCVEATKYIPPKG